MGRSVCAIFATEILRDSQRFLRILWGWLEMCHGSWCRGFCTARWEVMDQVSSNVRDDFQVVSRESRKGDGVASHRIHQVSRRTFQRNADDAPALLPLRIWLESREKSEESLAVSNDLQKNPTRFTIIQQRKKENTVWKIFPNHFYFLKKNYFKER